MPQSEFALHPKLEGDTFQVLDLPLCRVRLMNDSRFPWLILIPRRPDLREMHALGSADRFQLMEEACGVAAAVERTVSAQKMNVAALGNMVPQLHVHVIARFEADAAWPGPVWCAAGPEPYTAGAAENVAERYRKAIDDLRGVAPDGR